MPETRLSCERMTICVQTDEKGVIQQAPAIVRKFHRQHIDELVRWLTKRFGAVLINKLE